MLIAPLPLMSEGQELGFGIGGGQYSSDSASDDSSSGGFRSAAGVTGGDVVTPSPKDVNGGMVNVVDLIEVLICFGRAATPGCEPVDVVTDGIVDVMDLLDLLTDLGTSCP